MGSDAGLQVRDNDAVGVSAAYVSALLGSATLAHLLDRIAPERTAPSAEDRIDYLTAWKLLNAHVEAMADEGHRLSNTAVPTGNFELMIASMLQGETLADGLRRMAEGARILRPDLVFKVGTRSRELHLSVRFTKGETLAQAVYLEALVTLVHCAVRWGLGRDLQPERVRGPAQIDPRGGSWLRLLSPQVTRDGEGVRLVYAATAGTLAFEPHAFGRWHEAAFAEYARLAQRQAHGLEAAAPPTAARVRELLLEGLLPQASVARLLAMSVPTLRRRLAEEGTSFRILQAELRRDAAQVLLLGDKSVDDIAIELGLSDSRCFRRACKVWFGGPPSKVRQALRWGRVVQLATY
ncbi:helix-turn-helix domain-containing protein [Phenylobacterium sp.]|uniref:helix-turn-helix transcriptional regulator n=1 Tax=Phenylobacterium sp. TaxID=1871053 RepID=UPI003BA848D0